MKHPKNFRNRLVFCSQGAFGLNFGLSKTLCSFIQHKQRISREPSYRKKIKCFEMESGRLLGVRYPAVQDRKQFHTYLLK